MTVSPITPERDFHSLAPVLIMATGSHDELGRLLGILPEMGNSAVTVWRNRRYMVARGVVAMVARRRDRKVEALQETRTLNPSPEAVTDAGFVAGADFFDARDVVQVKYEMVRRARVDGVPVTQAAAAFGFSRPSFYSAAEALDREGLGGLVPAKPGPRSAHKLTDAVCEYLEALLAGDGSLRPADLVAQVAEKFGLRVHPRSIERALARRRRRADRGDSEPAGGP